MKTAAARAIYRRTTVAILIVLLGLAASGAQAQENPAPPLRSVIVSPGVELHYIERGKGAAVIFIHGTLGDYSEWEGQLAPFGQSYRALAYSRRYNLPNSNALRPNYSATVDAEDLAALIKKLNLGKVHLIGHSYGAYAALLLAVKHPELVRTLVLAEAPVLLTGQRVPEAKERVLKEVRAAFANNDPAAAVRAVIDSNHPGMYDKIPAPYRDQLLRNARELEALVASNEMYPPLDPDAVRKITTPTLLISGANSQPTQKSIDEALARLLPQSHHITIPDADHSMWFQQPEACRKAVLEFLRGK